MSEIAIKIDRVSKAYKLYDKPTDRLKESIHPLRKKYHREFYALKDVSLEIKKGETIGIIGKNGSGKSTLLKIIAGVLNESSGYVEVNGRVSALLELGAGFNNEFTGIENIYLNGSLMGYSRQEIEKKIPGIIDFADIGGFINQPVKMYSSGMFVRLAFAVAINVDPDILIIDEALAVGDIFFQSKCYNKFEEFKEQGKTIIFVSHSLDSIIKYCHKAVLISYGEKIYEGEAKNTVDMYKKILVNCDSQKNSTFVMNTNAIWKKNIEVNVNAVEYGNYFAKIVDFGIFNEYGQLVTNFFNDEEVQIRIKVKFFKKIDNPIFAFTIKDIKGTEICGTNTLYEKHNIGTINADSILNVCFNQKITIAEGCYLVSLGCTGYSEGELIIYHRLYDIFSVNCLSKKQVLGITALKTEIEVYTEDGGE